MSDKPVNSESSLADELFLLVGYLLSSAHGLFAEPKGYGPYRLVDSAGRLLEIMAAYGLSDPFLEELKAALDAERFGNSSDAQLQAVLDDLCLRLARELKKRVG